MNPQHIVQLNQRGKGSHRTVYPDQCEERCLLNLDRPQDSGAHVEQVIAGTPPFSELSCISTRGQKVEMTRVASLPADGGRLASVLAGKVVLPAEDGWDNARRPWQLHVEQRPAAVVFPQLASDVAIAVRFATQRGLRVTAQGAGTAPRLWVRSTM